MCVCVCLKDLLFQQGRNQSCAFAMQESQRKEIPELHSGNQAVKDLPLKMELYVSHVRGLFTLQHDCCGIKMCHSHSHSPPKCSKLS